MTELKLKKINNFKVEPLQLSNNINDKVKGSVIFPLPYLNIFICAKKRSGKTNLIYRILEKRIGQPCEVYAFVSSLNIDPSYQKIKELVELKGGTFHGMTSLYDEDGKDVLMDIIKNLETPISDEKEYKQVKVRKINVLVNNNDVTEKESEELIDVPIKKKKQDKLSSKIFFIFDDISNEIRSSPSLSKLCKMHRHLASTVIISSQYVFDVKPDVRNQIDLLIMFSGVRQDKALTIFKDINFPLDEDELYNIYKAATVKKYSFLVIDVRNSILRLNFDTEIIY